MKCSRNNCFAWSPVFGNNCSILTDTKGCRFYKTKDQLRREEEALKGSGHPVYQPSVTRQERRLLSALLRSDGQDGRMDKD